MPPSSRSTTSSYHQQTMMSSLARKSPRSSPISSMFSFILSNFRVLTHVFPTHFHTVSRCLRTKCQRAESSSPIDGKPSPRSSHPARHSLMQVEGDTMQDPGSSNSCKYPSCTPPPTYSTYHPDTSECSAYYTATRTAQKRCYVAHASGAFQRTPTPSCCPR